MIARADISLYSFANSVSVSKQDRKVWICKSCNIYFEPKPPDYQCPKCKGNTTYPVQDYNKDKHRLWKSQIPVFLRRKSCPKCDTTMRIGNIVEVEPGYLLTTFLKEMYWSPTVLGLIGLRARTIAYACPRCGYVEQYILNIERDRETVLKGITQMSVE